MYKTSRKIFFAISFSIVVALIGTQASVAQTATKENILQAIINVKSQVPSTARTASFLGTERIGSGVVIDSKGLILTIGYLILEAEKTEITSPDGNAIEANIIAYDHDSGFGLIRATKAINVPPMRFGSSAELAKDTNVLVVSRGGDRPIIGAKVVSRREFTGSWEYLLENAIFTSPPHTFHSGAALVSEEGRLLGIGSLIVNNALPGAVLPGNMFVPIDILKPILGDLLEKGRREAPHRPWIGANTSEISGRLIINRVSKEGPAEKAGLGSGDFILGVEGEVVSGQADFYRKLWASGSAGSEITLNVLPAKSDKLQVESVKIKTVDRSDWLRLSQTY